MSDADLPSALAPIVCLPIGKLHYLFLDSFPLFTTSKNVGKDKALCCRLLRRLKAKVLKHKISNILVYRVFSTLKTKLFGVSADDQILCRYRGRKTRAVTVFYVKHNIS